MRETAAQVQYQRSFGVALSFAGDSKRATAFVRTSHRIEGES
jgi:hypothetical protein